MPPDPRVTAILREFAPSFGMGRILELLLTPADDRLGSLREARMWLEIELGRAAHERLTTEAPR